MLQLLLQFFSLDYIAQNYDFCLQADKGTQFVSKLLEALCFYLILTEVMTTMYYSHSNRRAETSTQLSPWKSTNVLEYWRDCWDRFLQVLTYSCSIQVQSSVNLAPFFLVLSIYLLRQPSFDNCTGLQCASSVTTSPRTLRAPWCPAQHQWVEGANKQFTVAQQRHKANHYRWAQQGPPVLPPEQYICVDMPLMKSWAAEQVTTRTNSE